MGARSANPNMIFLLSERQGRALAFAIFFAGFVGERVVDAGGRPAGGPGTDPGFGVAAGCRCCEPRF
jgi:hypothetical protein